MICSLRKPLITMALTAALATSVFATLAAPVFASGVADTASRGAVPTERLVIAVGKSQFVDIGTTIGTVVLGDPSRADVVLVNPNRFYVLGKAIGTTNVQILAPGGEVMQVMDLVISADIDETAAAIRAALPGSTVKVHSVNGRIRLSGSVEDDLDEARALEIAQSFSDLPVINTLIVRAPKQVFLQVRIIEAARSFGQELGVNLSTLSLSAGGNLNGSVLNSSASQDAQAVGATSARMGSIGINATAEINALVRRGLARYLASPTLTALSGETASFLAGGEVPIPVSAGDNPSIQFKEFGVRLNFTPNVLDRGRINLVLEPEVSQLDLNNSYAANGVQIPGFSTRRASTTVELNDGESFVIAGLLQTSELRGTRAVPYLADVPLLGPMFRKSELSDQETELLIIVTPTLTRPVADGSTIITPLDGTRATRGAELFADGRVQRRDYDLNDALVGKGIAGNFGPVLTIGGRGAFHAN